MSFAFERLVASIQISHALKTQHNFLSLPIFPDCPQNFDEKHAGLNLNFYEDFDGCFSQVTGWSLITPLPQLEIPLFF